MLSIFTANSRPAVLGVEARFYPTTGSCYVHPNIKSFYLFKNQNKIISCRLILCILSVIPGPPIRLFLLEAFRYFSSSLLVMPRYISFLLYSWSFQTPSDHRIKLFTDLLTMYVLPSPFFVLSPSLDNTMSNLPQEILHPLISLQIRSTYISDLGALRGFLLTRSAH